MKSDSGVVSSALRAVPSVAGLVGSLAVDYVDQHVSRILHTAPFTMPLLMFEITRRCNLRCQYCGFPDFYPDFGAELTTAEVQAVLQDCVTLKTKIVSFGGGEPFIRQDFVDLVAYARSLGLQVHIDTNGTRLNSDVIARIPDGSDLAIIFSLDHPDVDVNDKVRGPGSYDGVVNAAKILRAERPNISIGINCVAGEHNVGRLGDMVELATSLGMHGIKFLPLHQNLAHRWRFGQNDEIPLDPHDSNHLWLAIRAASRLARARGMYTNSRRFVDMVRDYPDSLPPNNCFAGYLFGNIDPYGNLFPCYDIMHSLNVRDGGLVAAWKSPAMEAMRKDVRNCCRTCLCSGAMEASLRMSPVDVLKDPLQLVDDLKFFFGSGRG